MAGVLVLAHGFVQLEFKKYTSNYQFTLILLTALAIGIALDLRYSTWPMPVSYTHLRAHETVLDLVCRLLLEKKNT